jgi:GTPase SAR1 family protein
MGLLCLHFCLFLFIYLFIQDQERFRSLTQNYYRRAQCVLLLFDLYNEISFFNLSKWHSDALNYCRQQTDQFAIVLVGIKRKSGGQQSNQSAERIEQTIVEEFQQQHQFIIGYSEIDLNNEKSNLKEPFETLLDHFEEKRFLSTKFFNADKAVITGQNQKSDFTRKTSAFAEIIDDYDDDSQSIEKARKCRCIIY